MAEMTGLEPAIADVTGRYPNHLDHISKLFIFKNTFNKKMLLKMVGRTGFEPVTRGLKVHCSTN